MDYQTFLQSKVLVAMPQGKQIEAGDIHPILFPFQRDIVKWAVRKGRASIFADTGLGKTFMQLEWARFIGGRILIVAPLSIARQTVREAYKIDLEVHYTRSGEDLTDGINITNYEMVEHFDPAKFNAVVLDESSILKSLTGKTRARLTEMFQNTNYRLCCTATPAPNDITELGQHAEFLGIMTQTEMLSAFFINDMRMTDGTWRLKHHAEKPFYEWLSSWAMAITKPSDLGYDDDGYNLPPLNILASYVDSNWKPDGQLFAIGLKGIGERSQVRHITAEARVAKGAALVNDSDEQWIVWCGLNEESSALEKAIPDAIEVVGSDSPEKKAQALEDFIDGKYRVLISKPKIAGFGMNFQNCHNMAFVGLSDSWEAYYQCIRRCYRFGQLHEVNAHVVLSDVEGVIFDNVMSKEKEAKQMQKRLITSVADLERDELTDSHKRQFVYTEGNMTGQGWQMWLGDSCVRMAEIPDNSLDFMLESPPFISLYTYTPTERDLGNSANEDQFFKQYQFIITEKLRTLKPGRIAAVHVQQVAAQKFKDGFIGLKDFRGDVIRAYVEAGWIYHGEITIDKDPQVQAIRTKAKGLLFVQKDKDSSWSRPGLADYLIIFRKPGENVVPIQSDVSNDEWIQWARPVWYGIRESNTLNTDVAKSNEDERHICPLQLDLIERAIRLWSNKGETVFSPFAGIGSEGVVAIEHNRQFLGIELKPEYHRVACRNLDNAKSHTMDLFAWAESENREES